MQLTRASYLFCFSFLLAAGPAPAAALGASGCAPGGATPVLSIQPTPTGSGFRLRVANAPPLGTGFVLVESPETFGLPDPRPLLPGCAAEARGLPVAVESIDGQGEIDAVLPLADLAGGVSVTVLCLPQGGSLVDVSLSNAVIPVPPGVAFSGGGTGAGTGPGALGPPPLVVIVEFMKDPTTVSDGHGEWVELYNAESSPVDVEGWVVSDLGSDSAILSNAGAGMVIPPQGYLVLGRDADPTTNGGTLVDYEYAGMTLSNGDDEIVVSLPNGIVVDSVAYDDGASWPDTAGRSISLSTTAFDALLNDDGSNWCHSTTVLGASNPDTGTPGAANDPCAGG